MRVTHTEMALILDKRHGKPSRRMMRLPVSHSEEMIERPCPMVFGGSYVLSDGARSTHVSVVEVPRREPLGLLDSRDARHEGYPSVALARQAFEGHHGGSGDGRIVWVIAFAVTGTERDELSDTPVFLAKSGEYTTIAGRQAVPGDPEVCILPGEGERARVLALARDEAPTRDQVEDLIATGEILRASMTSMKARNRAALIVREAEKLRAELRDGPFRAPDALRSARAAS